MKYQAVVWDLDGTLTDSAPGIMQSVRYALHKMNYPPLEEHVLRKFLGPPLAESFQQFCGMSHEEAIQATHFYKEVYNQTNWKKNAVYPGIRPLLETAGLLFSCRYREAPQHREKGAGLFLPFPFV